MALIDDLSVRIPEAQTGILQQAVNDAEGMILDVPIDAQSAAGTCRGICKKDYGSRRGQQI